MERLVVARAALELRLADLGAEEADVADVVLRAGVRAAGEVHIDRRIQRYRALEVIADGERMPLGVTRRELAAGVAGAGDDAGARRAHARIQPQRRERR